MPTTMRFLGVALGLLALGVPLFNGGAMEGHEIASCQSGGGVCGDAMSVLQAGGDRIASYF
ncbi:MAG: hypothetical protein AB7T37_18190 [Dehalococcoidia bacterium]